MSHDPGAGVVAGRRLGKGGGSPSHAQSTDKFSGSARAPDIKISWVPNKGPSVECREKRLTSAEATTWIWSGQSLVHSP